MGHRAILYYLPSALALLAMLLAWHLLVVGLEVKEFVLPGPLAAIAALGEARFDWWLNTAATLLSVAGSFVLSAVLGIALAVAVVWDPRIERTVMPLLVLFNTLPKIALAPLFLLWLGYGIVPNILIGVTVAFFPMVINTAVGLRAVEPDLLALTQAMRATRWQVLRKIRFPNAIPYIFAGLKLNASMSVVGAIVGEFVASEKGLGAVIMAAGVTLDTPAIFAALILISVLGLAIYALVVAAERWLTPWERREDTATA
ncbi:ABC transporter permease [Falsiroseomonas oryzae]|uniref:ABC transporter permease n=1 Tax=Falsiroseomonas oryzae TaxID=2766473 RepID=UPI0022EACCF2|nr:ABC transporter permease [Roseomonas sp. MO-31]